MGRRVAAHTLAARLETEATMGHVRRERIDVALQAEKSPFAAQEIVSRDAAVRAMARHAALHFDCCVLENIRPALLHVATDADFKVGLLEQGPAQRAMGIVAIGALHQPFRHSVMSGQCELRLDRRMTGETQLRLRLCEQALIQPAVLLGQCRPGKEWPLRRGRFHVVSIPGPFQQMRGVTLLARDALQLVFGAVVSILVLAGVVARQAARGILRGLAAEPVNQHLGRFEPARVASRLPHPFDVRPAGPMAGFTSCTESRACHRGPSMHGLGELPGLVRVTRPTRCSACLIFGLSFRGRPPGNGGRLRAGGLLLRADLKL